MIKYIISSGNSIVSELLEIENTITFKITNEANKAIFYNTIGEAMINATKVNEIVGAYKYHAMSIEN